MAAAAKLLLSLFVLHQLAATAYSIGVNYGTLGDNLPPPPQVVEFLKTKTNIDAVKIFDVNPDIIKAFANSNISLTVTIPNGEIPSLTNMRGARRWIATHVRPFYPATKIKYILMGNEILHWGDDAQKNGLVPAMRTLQNALRREGMRDIKVSTPHSLGILMTSEPPSSGRFYPHMTPILADQLRFHRQSKTPFMFNPYPYFGWSVEKESFALFRPNKGIFDPRTKITYTNMYDSLMDAVHSAVKALGYTDVDFVAAETGWPSVCEYPACSVQNAVDYNGNLIKHVNSGKGTPLMPNRKFETYIFALFNENQKPGPTAEKNFGLFRPDFTPVYNAGVLINQQGGPMPGQSTGGTGTVQPGKGGRRAHVKPAPAGGDKKWCVAKPRATPQALQANIDFVCSQGVDCKPINQGGACSSNDLAGKASYLMNAYFQSHGKQPGACDFSGSGQITAANPSRGACVYGA